MSDTQAPTTRSRRARRPSGDDREAAILATLERLLEERPLHAISVDDLARGAGISRPTFYFYFASKEAVLLSLFDRMVTEAREEQGDPVEGLGDDPEAQVRRGISAFHRTFRRHRAVTLAGADAAVTSDELREMWSRVMAGFADEASEAIEAERARGAAPDTGIPARDLATTLVRMNERVLHTSFAGLEPAVPEDRVVDVLVAVWLAAIYG
jgi:TetR/AcrR family transcriptional regulator, ethionamide resistance regulator